MQEISYSNKPLIVDPSSSPVVLSGPVVFFSTDTIYFQDLSSDGKPLVQLTGSFTDNGAIQLQDVQGTIQTVATYSNGVVTDSIDYGSSGISTSSFMPWQKYRAGGRAGNDRFESQAATAQADVVSSGGGNDIAYLRAGNDTFDGGAGTDTAIFQARLGLYSIRHDGASTTVADSTASRDGTDALTSVERLRFTDFTVAYDLDGAAGQGYRLYQAAFNRTPDTNGVSYWVNNLDHGMSLQDVARSFVTSAEYQSIYGTSPTSERVVERFYSNVLGRTPDTDGLNYWIGVARGGMSTPDLLIQFSESGENQSRIAKDVENGINLSTDWIVI